ncbi:MAG: DNA double-strand break repair nuclease NurA, partial [candidate division WOR-3 bacterium]
MEEIVGEEAFRGLPGALVDEMIKDAERLGEEVLRNLETLKSIRAKARESLQNKGLMRRVDDLPRPHAPSTTCGVDGAYGVEKMLGYDLVVCTGLAVEGLVPPKETGLWREPRFEPFMSLEKHRDENTVLARALMMCFELQKAVEAPHKVVFLDGSLTTPIIYLNQGLSKLGDVREGNLRDNLVKKASEAVDYYSQILTLQRCDHIFVGVPKYTTKKEMGIKIGMSDFDDRALATLILEPGEFAGPMDMTQPQESGWSGWHLNREFLSEGTREKAMQVEQALSKIKIVYYKPAQHAPALRLEFPEYVASSEIRLAIVLEAVRDQSSIPGIVELYPLYYADMMAKSIGVSIPAIRQILTRRSVEDYSGKLEDVFFA